MKVVKIVLALLTLALVMSASLGTLPSASAQATIDSRVFEQLALAPTGEVTFLVQLAPRADLRALQGIRDRIARRTAVAAALKRTAEASQAPVRALLADLERQGLVSHVRAFFTTNTIAVTGRREAVLALAGARGVNRIEAEGQISLAGSVVSAERSSKPRVAVEPNINQIRAPAVWRLGFQGQGVIVGTIDTGVRWTHEALQPGYKCLRAASHKKCWFDAIKGIDTPYDDYSTDIAGHGTEVTGIIAGRLGIGVARKAKWVACKAFDANGFADKADILQCADFFTALALDANTAVYEPDVVTNTWVTFDDDTFFNAVVDAWNASGIHSAFGIGASGPDCLTTSLPGEYVGAFAVGGVDGSDLIASWSSRGPAGRTNIKPDVVAPGVSIRSSAASCDTCYEVLSGYTPATPHAAGTLALMISKNGSLTPAEARAIAENNAKHISDLTCGGSADDNNVYGHGRIDALNAVNATP